MTGSQDATQPAPNTHRVDPLGGAGLSADQVRRAYATLTRLQTECDDLRAKLEAPMAIVGIACRFPGGSSDPGSFWDALVTGRDAISTVPKSRFDVDELYDPAPQTPGRINSRHGGFVSDIDRFDHEFFSISAREATVVDPQHRLLLEVCWEALEDAYIDPTSLAGSRTAVFVAIANNDYAGQTLVDVASVTAHASTGSAHSIAAGRISYLLDLRGPSVAVDSACSSSLTAIHQATRSLRLGETELAICAGVNVILSPAITASFSQFPDMLAKDGRCKTFDADADGFVRSEGAGAVILKRLSDAQRDGDRIWAVVRGTALNQDGRTSGLTSPNGDAQREVIRLALKDARVTPAQIGFIETHGAGTRLGDPIELDSLVDVFGRSEGPDLFLGAVKTNVGHLETVAGMAGLIKAALAVHHGRIPGNLHFHRLNPHIRVDGTMFRFPTETVAWPPGYEQRVAGVSSFGFSGTNAHVVLSEPPAQLPRENDARDTRPFSVLPLSAKSPNSLAKLVRRYQDRLAAADAREFADVCHTAGAGRAHFPHRLAVTAADGTEAAARLGRVARGTSDPQVVSGHARTVGTSDTVFLFTGQGAQRVGMAHELYGTEAYFRGIIDRCAELLEPHLEVSLLDALWGTTDPGLIDEMSYGQPGLFAVEYAMAQLWRHWGLQPAALLGHSIGEIAAACVAGVMPLEDALPLVAARGRLLAGLADTGAMLAVHGAPEVTVRELAAFDPAAIALAAVNSPHSATVSGRRDEVVRFADRLTNLGVECDLLNIRTASHSPLVDQIIDEFRVAASRVRMSPPRIPLVSNVDGQLWRWDSPPPADYWIRHVRRPVQFLDGLNTLLGLGHRTFVEVGPTAVLLGFTGELAADSPDDTDLLLLPSLRRSVSDGEVLASAIARLYAAGADLNWPEIGAGHGARFIPAPHYAFDRVRCWHAPSADASWHPAAEPSEIPSPSEVPVPLVSSRRLAMIDLETLLGVPSATRADALLPHVSTAIQIALGTARAPDVDLPLISLGLDSLLALELRNEVRRQLRVQLSVADLMNDATLRSLCSHIVEVVSRQEAGEVVDPDDNPIRRSGAGSIDQDLLAQVEAMAVGNPEGRP